MYIQISWLTFFLGCLIALLLYGVIMRTVTFMERRAFIKAGMLPPGYTAKGDLRLFKVLKGKSDDS